jgi:hypothetical protein
MFYPISCGLILPCLLLCAMGSGCKKRDDDKPTPNKLCPKAAVAWHVDSKDSGLKRGGLSTHPEKFAERLMPLVPNWVHGWVKQCRSQKKWSCKQAAVAWMKVGAEGKITKTEAVTKCAAARCLAKQAQSAKLPPKRVPAGTRICFYLQLN